MSQIENRFRELLRNTTNDEVAASLLVLSETLSDIAKSPNGININLGTSQYQNPIRIQK
jgi:hypothetical protein